MSVGTRANFRRAALEAAAELFASRDDVSMSEVAEAIGVGRATLYRHYDSREALLRDLTTFAFDVRSRMPIWMRWTFPKRSSGCFGHSCTSDRGTPW